MQNKQTSRIALIGGATIVALICALVFLFKMPYTGGPQGIALSVYVGFIFYIVFAFSKRQQESEGLKVLFYQGFRGFLIMALFIVLFTFVFYKLNNSFLENGIAANTQLIREQGNRTEAEILENNQKLRNIFMPMMLSVTTVILLILGALSSLVAAALFKKK